MNRRPFSRNVSAITVWLLRGMSVSAVMASATTGLFLGTGAHAGEARGAVEEIIQGVDDEYAFMWWAQGWRGRKVRCLQTSSFGLAFDVEDMRVSHFGAIAEPLPYAQAARQSNAVIFGLPPAVLELSVVVGATTYSCRGGGHSRLIESGRFLQRFDIEDLLFSDDAGAELPADGRLEVVAWPDRLSLLLAVRPREDMRQARSSILFHSTRTSGATANWKQGDTQTLAAIAFDAAPGLPPEAVTLRARSLRSDKSIPVVYDRARGWHRVELPPNGRSEPNAASLQRIHLQVENPTPTPRVLRIQFAREGNVAGITGLVPMLRDADQNPLPVPVQISKNWHRTAGRTFLYQGSWMHAFTMLKIPGPFTGDLEFCVARNFWGTLPVASHAQLCLIGWGTDQLWDQAAIGSWGESICYDPDVCLGRSVIDDMRPLMVTRKDSHDGRWGWSNNVGGGDFLVYFNQDNQKQFLSRMRTAYFSQGPNLTDVLYAGESADGNISATMRVMTPRCDDINRAYHSFRYDVLKPTRFQRLAFYQVGADNYNDHQFRKLARGNMTGLLEEWDASPGGRRYHRKAIPCPGDTPWFSLHEAISKDRAGGAWANRGLVLRAWKARLGGRECPPVAASYGTQNGPASCTIELVPPADLTELSPGDFVEATVELLVMPQFAVDYYGPNEALREDLSAGENTWKPVFRQASRGALTVSSSTGTVLSSCPVRIELDASQVADVAITGGVGYCPITFTGLRDYHGWELCRRVDDKWAAIDQSVYGNDFWQVTREAGDRFAITYNVLLDAGAGPQRFRFAPGDGDAKKRSKSLSTVD